MRLSFSFTVWRLSDSLTTNNNLSFKLTVRKEVSNMKHFIFCFIWLFAYEYAATSPVIKDRSEVYHVNNTRIRDYNAITCVCSNGIVTQEIDRVTTSEIVSGFPRCSKTADVCDLLKSCNGCSVVDEICYPAITKNDSNCRKTTYFLKDGIFDELYAEGNRVKRDIVSYCTYPQKMQTADVSCKIGGRKVFCTQECIKGYTLKEGPIVKLECSTSEKRWKPDKFRECEPYLDCTVSIITGGIGDCYTATTKTQAMCYIQCEAYEEHHRVHRRAYRCTPSGRWQPQLPFCAKAGSNLALVAPPGTLDKV